MLLSALELANDELFLGERFGFNAKLDENFVDSSQNDTKRYEDTADALGFRLVEWK